MPRKRYSTEQIVTKLRQAEVELGRGLRTPCGLPLRPTTSVGCDQWKSVTGREPLRLADQVHWAPKFSPRGTYATGSPGSTPAALSRAVRCAFPTVPRAAGLIRREASCITTKSCVTAPMATSPSTTRTPARRPLIIPPPW